MKDYRKLVPREAPEGLLAFIGDRLDTAGMVYETCWVEDESVDAILTDRPRKIRAVRITCSECQKSAIMDYMPPGRTYRGGKSLYGFCSPVCQGMEVVRDGDSVLCPICGTPTTVRNGPRLGDREFCSAEENVLAASLLPGVPGERPLVLTAWNVRRMVNRYGRERYEKRPMEAYVFEKHEAYKLMGWVKSYSGSCGYFTAVLNEWKQQENWSETWGQCRECFGLTPELVADSCLHNSKFDSYMQEDWRCKWKSPVPYLRLYQNYPQVENLVVQGCTHILDDLFSREMRGDIWKNNTKGLVVLEDIDFNEVRPAQMLGLTKAEFACMISQCWDSYHWEIFVRAKQAGDVMKLPEDIESLHKYGGEDVERLIGQGVPVGRALRYLLKQCEIMSVINDPYNEYGEYDVPVDGDEISADILADYWEMARRADWDLDDPAIRWPKFLPDAHDRAMAAARANAGAHMKKQFKLRYEKLSQYAYASGGLMIVPARNQEQLNKEGKVLHHCVAGYGENHALGKTAIFFVRQTWAKRTPYFTLEFDEKKGLVKQNRGVYNCAKTPEVAAFEKAWLKWIRGGCQRQKDGTPVGAKPVLSKNPNKQAHEKQIGAA